MTPLALLRTAWAAACLLLAAAVQAQAANPVTLLVGFAPGGTSDGVARLIAQMLPEQLGRPVIVENKAGAIGTLAIRDVVAAPPERAVYTLLPFSSVLFPALTQPSLRYNIFKDLRPVASVTTFPLGVVVSASVPARTPREFVAWLKTASANATFGTAGTGGHNHFLSLQLGKTVGTESTVVAYKGNAPLLTDLAAAHLPAAVMVAGEVIPHVKDGRLRIVGVLTPQRSPLMPDVPTFAEDGVAIDSGEAWYGLWASANAPKAELDKMQDALRKVLAMPEVREALASRYAMQADFRNAEQTDKRLRAAGDHWAPIIKASGFKAE